MMKLNDFKEEIYKCSGCGICQKVCPVYKILKTECAVSRGKFKLLNAIINKDIKYTKKTLKYMDLCLHCQACSEFCPSEIDAQKIIETAQYDMLSLGILNLPKILMAQILSNKTYMQILKKCIDFIRKHKILEKIDLFNCKNNKLARKMLEIKVPTINEKSNIEKNIKILYFKGCINNYVNPSCQNAVEQILDKTNVEILEADFNCCGLPLKSAGDFKSFEKIAKENIKLALEKNFDYLIFDCASCKHTFLSYANFLQGEYKIQAENISNKIKNIYELLDIIGYTPTPNANKGKVTIHYPCHTRGTNEKDIILKLLKKIKNINLIEMENADSCCGAAGSFILTNNKISKAISNEKSKNIINSGANIVLTTCPSCILGLYQGLIENNSDIKAMNIIEFLCK